MYSGYLYQIICFNVNTPFQFHDGLPFYINLLFVNKESSNSVWVGNLPRDSTVTISIGKVSKIKKELVEYSTKGLTPLPPFSGKKIYWLKMIYMP